MSEICEWHAYRSAGTACMGLLLLTAAAGSAITEGC